MTGHSRAGGVPADLDWRALADPTATTLFYMGGRTAAEIASRLCEAGMSRDTPVVIGIAVGQAAQRLVRTELARLAAAITGQDLERPVLIGVGQVFRERTAQSLMLTGSYPGLHTSTMHSDSSVRPSTGALRPAFSIASRSTLAVSDAESPTHADRTDHPRIHRQPGARCEIRAARLSVLPKSRTLHPGAGCQQHFHNLGRPLAPRRERDADGSAWKLGRCRATA